MENDYWITKEGEKIKIEDMTDNHLNNAIKFLERTAKISEPYVIYDAYCFLSSLNGEQAQYEMEGCISRMERDGVTPSELFPIYDKLIKEQEKRNEKHTSEKHTSL